MVMLDVCVMGAAAAVALLHAAGVLLVRAGCTSCTAWCADVMAAASTAASCNAFYSEPLLRPITAACNHYFLQSFCSKSLLPATTAAC